MQEDFEFGEVLPRMGGEIAPERWQRVREQVVFRDLARDILTQYGRWHQEGNAISCPFHGSDSTPSFNFYAESNSAFCFGCPPPKKNQMYDSVSFVSRFFEISPGKALAWIEKKYKMPFIAFEGEEEPEDDETEEASFFSFDDLKGVFLMTAPKLIGSATDAKILLSSYFTAQENDDALHLAKLLGRERLDRLKKRT